MRSTLIDTLATERETALREVARHRRECHYARLSGDFVSADVHTAMAAYCQRQVIYITGKLAMARAEVADGAARRERDLAVAILARGAKGAKRTTFPITLRPLATFARNVFAVVMTAPQNWN